MGQVKIYEKKMIIPTYEMSEPDKNPMLHLWRTILSVTIMGN